MPYRRVEIISPLSFAEVERRIASLVGPRRSFMEYFWRRPDPSDRPFEGKADGEGRFRFYRRIYHRNSFLPRIRARIEPDPRGTVVRLVMYVHPAVVAFMLFWIGAVLMGFFTIERSDRLIPGGMLLFAVALTLGAFYPEAFKAERMLRAELQAEGGS